MRRVVQHHLIVSGRYGCDRIHMLACDLFAGGVAHRKVGVGGGQHLDAPLARRTLCARGQRFIAANCVWRQGFVAGHQEKSGQGGRPHPHAERRYGATDDLEPGDLPYLAMG